MTNNLKVVFFPFLATGHILPIVSMANIMSTNFDVETIIITTTGNANIVKSKIMKDSSLIRLLTLPFPLSSSPENASLLPTPELTEDFLEGTFALEKPFEQLLVDNNIVPDCIVSDSLCPWMTDVAERLNSQLVIFYGSGNFACMVMGALKYIKPQAKDDEPFVIPGLPHCVKMTRSQIAMNQYWEPSEYWVKLGAKMHAARLRSLGTVSASLHELEPDYANMFRNVLAPQKVWNFGPLSLWNNYKQDSPAYVAHDCLSWLDKNKPGSVVYVCFGSTGRFNSAQLHEMAMGLRAIDRPFLWVLSNGGDESAWMPEGFEQGKGLVVRGWVPQVEVINHRAIGGFVTHCGTSSIMEGLSAGLPMITWPLFFDHFFNERLVIDVVKIGVAVGAMVSSYNEEDRTLVSAERLRMTVEEVMGDGEEAEERRGRARRLAEEAKAAVVKGGSSYNDMKDMIQEIRKAKIARMNAE